MGVHINYLAIVVAALVSYFLGFLWYSLIFNKPWKTLTGLTDMKSGSMAKTMALGFIVSLLMSYVLAYDEYFAHAFMPASSDLMCGLMSGFYNWLGFIATVTLTSVIYNKKPWKLWFLDNGYWLISMLLMGAILGLWK